MTNIKKSDQDICQNFEKLWDANREEFRAKIYPTEKLAADQFFFLLTNLRLSPLRTKF